VSVRRSITYAGLIFSLAALAFSFGSWTAQRSIAQQLAGNDARVTALRDDMARAILQIRQAETSASLKSSVRAAHSRHSSKRSSGSCRPRWG
jgi:hypothetical protein